MVYASEINYLKACETVPDDFIKLLEKASRAIDVLTYNRIITHGFENLTDFQKETITACCCEIVNFYDENRDLLDTSLNAYAINGVSMQFNFNNSVYQSNGVIIKKSTYSRLMSTGLCYGGI